MRRKAFCRVLKYPDPYDRHLDHVRRIRVAKSGLCGPDKVFIMGDLGCIPKPRDLPGKVKNRYMEIVVSGIEVSQVPPLQAYFRLRYDRAEVPAVYHQDEMYPHVHLLVPWINAQGRALRFPKSEFNAARVAAARIVGHEATLVGQGRRRIAMKRWQADPEGACGQAEAMSEADRATLDQIRELLRIYGPIDTYGVRKDGKKEALQGRIRQVEDLSLKRLHLMTKRGYVVHFCSTDAGRALVPVAFVDRVPESQVAKMPGNAVVVRTAGGQYQAHIPVDRRLDATARGKLEAWLAAAYDASAQETPLPVLPGFAASGGERAAIVAVRHDIPPLTYAEYQARQQRELAILDQHDRAFRQADAMGGYRLASAVKKGWREFYAGDAASADRGYALYLLGQGLTDEEAAHWLIMRSANIIARKEKVLTAYVQRVIDGARARLYGPDPAVTPSV